MNETSAVLARLVEKGAVVSAAGQGKAKYYQSAERMFSIYWLMRRHGEPPRRIKAVVDFMVHFYEESDIGGVVRRIAEETLSLPLAERELHYCACKEIFYAKPTEQWKSKCMEVIPVNFFQADEVPADIKSLGKEKAKDSFARGLQYWKAGDFCEAGRCFDAVLS